MKRKFFFIAIVCLNLFSSLSVLAKSIVPEFDHHYLKNGAEVYFFKSPSVPIFEVEVVYPIGSLDDPDGKSGLAMLTAAMMKRGVEGFDEDAFNERLDALAGSIEIQVRDHTTSFSAYGLNHQVLEILDLFFRVLDRPVFSKKVFERIRSNQIDHIKKIPDSAESLAAQVFDRWLFDKTKRARPGIGYLSDLQRLRFEDINNFYSKISSLRNQVKVMVIGGEDSKEILSNVETKLVQVPQSDLLEKKPQEIHKINHKTYSRKEFKSFNSFPKKILFVPAPGLSEAHVQMGFLGPSRMVPEYYDLCVAETVLSGYFASRMNMIIREKLNLTYGVSAGFQMHPDVGYFNLVTSTRNEKLGELLKNLNLVLHDFAKNGVTDAEVEFAKGYLMGAYPLGLQNRYSIANTYFTGVIHGLGASFIDEYLDRIKLVNRESVQQALKKYFSLNDLNSKLKVVISGDGKKIIPVLKANHVSVKPFDIRNFF